MACMLLILYTNPSLLWIKCAANLLQQIGGYIINTRCDEILIIIIQGNLTVLKLSGY